MTSTLATVVVFVVSLLIGGLGIYVGARVVADYDDYTYAVITALLGAIGWGIITFFLGGLIGSILALIVYLAIINWRYPGGWGSAIAISLIAWIASWIVLYVLALINLVQFDALGVPGP